MARHENLLLVRMLRYQGQLTDQDLEVVLVHAERADDHHELLDRLAELGIVDEEWKVRAARYLRAKARSVRSNGDEIGRFDRSFGQVAIAKGWVVLSDLETALLEQERLRRSNLNFRLGEIMVRSGKLDVGQVRQILREQGYEVLRCETCDLVLEVDSPAESCPSCKGALIPPVFLEVVRSDHGAKE